MISLLAKYCIPISVDIILEAYEVSKSIVGETPEGIRKLSKVEIGEVILRTLSLGREWVKLTFIIESNCTV